MHPSLDGTSGAASQLSPLEQGMARGTRRFQPGRYMATPAAGSTFRSPKYLSCSRVGLASMGTAWSGLVGSVTSFSVSVAGFGQDAEAVDEAVGGAPGVSLPLRTVPNLRRPHRRGPSRACRVTVIVPGEHRGRICHSTQSASMKGNAGPRTWSA